ncbi:sodium-dependent multivitamin transporter-like [Mizuhopecten yessoensis]|uniref:Sodium/iodide cotransporter n=1 Tax=Mizuhopecten yessoensis TaxID=6573 RepID=A0A210Q928_MIZYE|nr:sodium-dependent multivitamin transporter-like [Mizuhopecten yessoensis]OWF45231.1 Sodium/iodide cotransporter [Mizuhopecten yessoensis]
MFSGTFAILIKGTMEVGGVANTWSIVKEKGRSNLIDFNPDPTIRQSFWRLFVWGLIYGFKLQFTQASFQRIKATPTVAKAKQMYFIACFLFLLISGLAVLDGAVMFAYYHTKGCDPLLAKQVNNQNQLMAKMVRDIFQDIPCLPGLFLASLFSAALSTMSSVLSAMSAMFWEDIVKPHMKPMSERKAMRITQLSVFIFGGLTIIVTFAISGIDGPISRICDITGACIIGALYGMMLLGWFVPRANSLGALVGGMVSFLFVGWISFGKLVSSGVRVDAKLEPASTDNCPVFNVTGMTNATLMEYTYSEATWNSSSTIAGATQTDIVSEPQGLDILYSLSYKWLMPIGFSLVFIVGSIISRFQAREPVDPSLIIPVCDYLCCCIPERIRRKIRCGVEYPGTDKKMVEDEAESMKELVSAQKNVPTI